MGKFTCHALVLFYMALMVKRLSERPQNLLWGGSRAARRDNRSQGFGKQLLPPGTSSELPLSASARGRLSRKAPQLQPR